MTSRSKIFSRFAQLLEEAVKLEMTKHTDKSAMYGSAEYIDHEAFTIWGVKVQNLLRLACGSDSIHLKEFQGKDGKGYATNYGIFKAQRAVLIAAQDDYDNGLCVSIRDLVASELFDDELEQAEQLAGNGYHAPAAVIAGAVLETALRTLCTDESIELDSKPKLDKMNADLAKAGRFTKLIQKRITAIADIRNSAAHGKWDEFSRDDVELMIRDVRHYLTNGFQ